VQPENGSPPKSRIVGHVFIEPDDTISITPSIRISESDEQRLRAVSLGFAIWRSVNDRLTVHWPAHLRAHFLASEALRRRTAR
jgi:hypothetical protein